MKTREHGAVTSALNKPTQALDKVWSPKGKIREADLGKIWAGQSFSPAALALADGRSLRVILPGRPGGGTGPDFRDAVIAIDGDELRGDVELHLHASSFRSHGHNRDPAYNRVVLHVVVWADDEVQTRLSNGGQAPVASFEAWLAKRSDQIEDWLQNASIWREPCTKAAERFGEEGLDALLDAQGEARFSLKTARLLDAISVLGEPAAFWQALLDGLGYGGDRSAWRRLSLALPPDSLAKLTSTNAVEPILMAVAGFAPPPSGVTNLPSVIYPPMNLGSRPANDPRNRLAGLARLWERAEADLTAFAIRSFRDAASVTQLVSRWQVMDTEREKALLGRQRAGELVLNLILPYAATQPELKRQAETFAHEMRPAPAYGKTAHLEQNLRRPDGRRRVRTAQQQQGLLALEDTGAAAVAVVAALCRKRRFSASHFRRVGSAQLGHRKVEDLVGAEVVPRQARHRFSVWLIARV